MRNYGYHDVFINLIREPIGGTMCCSFYSLPVVSLMFLLLDDVNFLKGLRFVFTGNDGDVGLDYNLILMKAPPFALLAWLIYSKVYSMPRQTMTVSI